MFELACTSVGGDGLAVLHFHRLIQGSCNPSGTYPLVDYFVTSCDPRGIFPGRHYAKIFTFGNVLVYFCAFCRPFWPNCDCGTLPAAYS